MEPILYKTFWGGGCRAEAVVLDVTSILIVNDSLPNVSTFWHLADLLVGCLDQQ